MAERVAVFASEERIASVISPDIANPYSSGLVATLEVSSKIDSPSVVFTLQGKSDVGSYYDILTSAAITTSGTTIFRVFPGATPASNVAVNDVLPAIWRVRAIHGDTDPITYALIGNMIP